ncbi:hypothetical protein [Candidatus Nesciobacter abundans]|uniref:Uncharacterized protein n=1 Tax=Candidatus Nesciobacter abundans TaxID=2601668 RepID=A0A5C0UGW5_9PROT|nr:hypothetical protein [Candidatus Nesciobacter abundans]QEK39049.1 hypothetical protein FZC36_01190 [Candidatus Nesciobacter abundans]
MNCFCVYLTSNSDLSKFNSSDVRKIDDTTKVKIVQSKFDYVEAEIYVSSFISDLNKYPFLIITNDHGVMFFGSYEYINKQNNSYKISFKSKASSEKKQKCLDKEFLNNGLSNALDPKGNVVNSLVYSDSLMGCESIFDDKEDSYSIDSMSILSRNDFLKKEYNSVESEESFSVTFCFSWDDHIFRQSDVFEEVYKNFKENELSKWPQKFSKHGQYTISNSFIKKEYGNVYGALVLDWMELIKRREKWCFNIFGANVSKDLNLNIDLNKVFSGCDEWKEKQFYKKNDSVSYEKSIFICAVDHFSGLVFDLEYWIESDKKPEILQKNKDNIFDSEAGKLLLYQIKNMLFAYTRAYQYDYILEVKINLTNSLDLCFVQLMDKVRFKSVEDGKIYTGVVFEYEKTISDKESILFLKIKSLTKVKSFDSDIIYYFRDEYCKSYCFEYEHKRLKDLYFKRIFDKSSIKSHSDLLKNLNMVIDFIEDEEKFLGIKINSVQKKLPDLCLNYEVRRK